MPKRSSSDPSNNPKAKTAEKAASPRKGCGSLQITSG